MSNLKYSRNKYSGTVLFLALAAVAMVIVAFLFGSFLITRGYQELNGSLVNYGRIVAIVFTAGAMFFVAQIIRVVRKAKRVEAELIDKNLRQ